MKLLIGGDFFVSGDYGKSSLMDEGILDLFRKSFYNILNLEAPITTSGEERRIMKTGPHLKTAPDIMTSQLRELEVDLLTLANNHILDFGKTGLSETLSILSENGIGHVGAGEDLESASRPFVIIKNDLKISIINICENEWSSARPGQAGANPMDLINNIRLIWEAKEKSDFVILIVHGGHEHYQLPSPGMLKLYRFYAECGVSLIAGHHPHCISGYEIHKGVPIFYSLGNFLFTKHSEIECRFTGLLLQLDVTKEQGIRWELLPIRQRSHDFMLELLEKEAKNSVLQQVEKLGTILKDESLIKEEWQKFLSSRRKLYRNFFSPIHNLPGRYLRSAFFRSGINRLFFSKKYLAFVINAIRCEAHREAVLEIFERDLSERI